MKHFLRYAHGEVLVRDIDEKPVRITSTWTPVSAYLYGQFDDPKAKNRGYEVKIEGDRPSELGDGIETVRPKKQARSE